MTMGTMKNCPEASQLTDIKWATMIPLIGGSALGCAKATGVLPQYHLSYTPFQNNEAHLTNYWDKVRMLYLDKNKDLEFGQEEIDFVNSVCPCAGLSMLNVSRKGEAKRGSDAVQNEWMLNSATFVLSTVRPKVLWGENAPGLFATEGRDLVDKLRNIGADYGYSFSMVKTNSELHGLPQRRMRTFYFFWKGHYVPIMDWKTTLAPSLVDYLAQIPAEASFQDLYVHDGKATERYLPYKYVLEREGMTHKEFSKMYSRGTVAKYLQKKGWMDDCIAWLSYYYPRSTFGTTGKGKTHIEVLEHMQRKLAQGLGYWDDSVKFMGEAFTAVISKNIEYAIHPTEDRFFNIRELLHLMGMPHDFEISNPMRNMNHICQNVPVNTARDFAEEVVKFCRGEAKLTRFSFIKQDNVTRSVLETFPKQEPGERQEMELSLKTDDPLWKDKSRTSSRGKRKSSEYLDMSAIKNEFYPEDKKDVVVKKEFPDYKKDVTLKKEFYPDGETNFKIKVEAYPGDKKDVKKEFVEDYLSSEFHSHLTRGNNRRVMDSFKRNRMMDIKKSEFNPMDVEQNKTNITRALDNYANIKAEVKLEKANSEVKQETDEKNKFRCGMCSFLTESRLKMKDHWTLDCKLVEPTAKPASYRCGLCGQLDKTTESMKVHWKNNCTSYKGSGGWNATSQFNLSMSNAMGARGL